MSHDYTENPIVLILIFDTFSTPVLQSKGNSAHAVTAKTHHMSPVARRPVMGAVWPGGPAAGLAVGDSLDVPGLLVGSNPVSCWGVWSCV